MRYVISRNMAFASSRKAAEKDTSQKYVKVYQDAKKSNIVKKDIPRTARDFLLELVADMKKNVPITTMKANMLRSRKK